MKISYNWIKDYLDIDYEPAKLGEILTNIGLEVEGIEVYESIPGSMAGIVVGEVLTCSPHPNADKLKITTVDYGEGPVQIVCGAPNVQAGQKVIVAKVGTTLYPTAGDPFQIKKAKIRGEESFGMICAEDEVGLGSEHDGIMVLEDTAEIGSDANAIFDLESDTIFDIGLTPNRSDATSHMGVAKDLLAYLKVNERYTKKIKQPLIGNFQEALNKSAIEIEVEDEEGCPRYSGLIISDIVIQESPSWIKNRLNAIGVRPINNIVDATNFVLHELGQPLHAFDKASIIGDKIIVKTLPEGSKFQSLDEVERILSVRDLMICDGASNGMCIAGVFGGAHSGVTSNTTEIFLESAYFNAKRIRVTSMKHLLRTDAAMCYEKGADPNITVIALKRAAMLICELSGGKITSPLIDIYPKKIEPKKIDVRYEKINSLIGVELSKEEIRDILNALEIEIVTVSQTQLTVAIPTNKVDVTREVDVIEEILRIYGFNQIETDDKLNYSFSTDSYPSPNFLYNRVSDYLVANGFFECMSLSLTQSSIYQTVLKVKKEHLVYINNTSNIHLDAMRHSMLPGMLENIRHNQNRQNQTLRLFEYGNTYAQRNLEEFEESTKLIFALAGPSGQDHWLMPKGKRQTYFSLKSHLENTLKILGLSNNSLKFEEINGHELFLDTISIKIENQIIGMMGNINSEILSKFDIKNEVYYAELDWEKVLTLSGKQKLNSYDIPKFPSTRRDLALEVGKNIGYGDLKEAILQSGAKSIIEIGLFDVFTNKKLDEQGKKSYAIYLIFQHPDKTLKDGEVDKSIQKIIKKMDAEFNAKLR